MKAASRVRSGLQLVLAIMLSGDTLPFAVGLAYGIVISASFGQIEIISSPAPENKRIGEK